MEAYFTLVRRDLEQLISSWLLRGWVVLLAAPAAFLVVVAAREDELASETLAAYVAAVLAPLSWIVISVLAGTAVSGEASTIADSVLSKSVTRSEYIWAKITSRLVVFMTIYFSVVIPFAYLIDRYATSNDTTISGVMSGVVLVGVLFVFLTSFGIALSTVFRNSQFAVVAALLTVAVSGAVLQFLGLKWMSTTAVIGGLPETFRGDTPFPDQLRVLVVFAALSLAAIVSGVWVFERRDL